MVINYGRRKDYKGLSSSHITLKNRAKKQDFTRDRMTSFFLLFLLSKSKF